MIIPIYWLIFTLSANLRHLCPENIRFFRCLPTSDTYVRKRYQILGVNPPRLSPFLIIFYYNLSFVTISILNHSLFLKMKFQISLCLFLITNPMAIRIITSSPSNDSVQRRYYCGQNKNYPQDP